MIKRSRIKSHFDNIAETYDSGKFKYSYYYFNLKNLLGKIVPKGKRVLEIGCGTGDLLASLAPKVGYGYDISSEMIKIAKNKHKGSSNLKFSTVWPTGEFDYIFMSDVIEHLENPKEEFKKISDLMGKDTLFVNTMANPLWEPLLMLWERMGWKMREGPHKRLSFEEIKNILEMSGMKVVKHDHELLIPIRIPLISDFANRYLTKYFKRLAFIEYFVCKK